MDLKQFGEQLQALRKQARLSQEGLVEALDQRARVGPVEEYRVIDGTLISRWERARTQASRQWKPTRAYVLHLIHIFAEHLTLETAQQWAAQAGYPIIPAELSGLFPQGAPPSPVTQAAAPPAPRHNLPATLTSFIGRRAEITLLTDYLLSPPTRLATIVGEGGIGKTRLALAVGQEIYDLRAQMFVSGSTELAEVLSRTRAPVIDEIVAPTSGFVNRTSSIVHFPDGVWFVPLAGLEGSTTTNVANLLATAIAKAIAFSFASADVEPATQVIRTLRSKAMLLVLDNFEHLTAGAPFVVELLQQAAQVSVLVTSRTPLNCQAEQLLWLEGLPINATDAAQAPSVQLFVERTRQQMPDFALDPQTTQQVMHLCRWVNSNPLAIELAAHWMQHYRLSEMINLLQQQNLALLETDQQDVPARHHTMTAVFETSWQLLSPHQQQTLAQLSVFRGPLTRAAAAAVTAATLPTLAALVNSSLLRQLRDSSGGVSYVLHELLRQFAAAKLRTVEQTLPAAAPMVQRRHSEYYLKLVAAQGEELYGSGMQSALAELQTNIDNIRAAWRWAVSSDSVALLRQAWFGLRTFYHVRCFFQEGEEVFRTATADLKTLLPRQVQRDDVAAELQIAQAFFLNQLNRHDQAITVAGTVLATMQGQAVTPLMARATLEWGIGLSSRGRHDEALTTLTQAATLARHLSLPALEARALHAMSRNFLYKGEFAAAEAALEQALHGYRQVGYQLAEGFVLRALGNLAYYAGRYTEALAQLEAALVIYQAAEDQPREVSLWKFLGDVYAALGDLGRALAYYRATYARRDEVEDAHHTAFLLARYAILLGRLGDYALGCQYAEQALMQQQQMGHQGGTVEALCALGWLENQMGNPAQALAYYRQAVETIRTSSNTVYEGAATLGMGKALAGRGAGREAQVVYQQALAIQRRLGRQPAVIETLCELARLALAQRLAADALQLVDEILATGDLATVQGVNEPLLCDLTCYQVLQANRDVRAEGVLFAAYQRLQTQAATINDDDLRRSFLKNVPVNQMIVAAYLKQNTQQDSPGNG